MINNVAGSLGGAIHGSATKLRCHNVAVSSSHAKVAGGGFSLAGEESSGFFSMCSWTDCRAGQFGGGLTVSNNVPSLMIQDGAFSRCSTGEQGGALHVWGSGLVNVNSTSFDDCSVEYSATPICLTVTMVKTTGTGWFGSELFVFKADEYTEDVMYSCPKTCMTWQDSCDQRDYLYGADASTCDAAGNSLTTTYGCDCAGCVCSGWTPPESYLYRFNLTDGYSRTEQVCFERNIGSGEYVILVTDDKYARGGGGFFSFEPRSPPIPHPPTPPPCHPQIPGEYSMEHRGGGTSDPRGSS